MYKKWIVILLLCTAILLGCMACKEEEASTSQPGELTDSQPVDTTVDYNSGVVDMPTNFLPPEENTTDEPTAPTETTGTVDITLPSETTESTAAPTEPSADPTDPSGDPTKPSDGADDPAAQMTFEEFMAMDPYAQTDFINTFEAADFHAWFQAALAEYKKEHPDFEYNGGAIELPNE